MRRLKSGKCEIGVLHAKKRKQIMGRCIRNSRSLALLFRKRPKFDTPVVIPMDANLLRGQPLYRAPQQVDEWIRAEVSGANACIARILRVRLQAYACAVWLTEADSTAVARRIAEGASARGELFQMVLYNVPHRDGGGFSSGGAYSRGAYIRYVRGVARGIGKSAKGIIVVEPDALAHANQFDDAAREERLALLRETCEVLMAKCAGVSVYIDAGHPGWLAAADAAALLKVAGVLGVRGFSLNVSHHHSTRDCVRYAKRIQDFLGDRSRFVIDVSRNGVGFADDGSQFSMINNCRARVGEAPTTRFDTSHPGYDGLDALLWIKVPGESDGQYRGAPPAGVFCAKTALRLLGEASDDDDDETHSSDLLTAEYEEDIEEEVVTN